MSASFLHRSSRVRARARAFTLTELMIALVMGLIISLAVVALGKTATQTFHDQARLSAAEGSVRTAVERLRADLTRVSAMGTGNIRLDPAVARINGSGSPWRYPQLQYLAGVRIDVRSQTPAGPGVPFNQTTAGTAANFPVQAAPNSFSPDTILIAGNLTSNDSYGGTFQLNGGGTSCGSGATIHLDARADAAVFSLLSGSGGGPGAKIRSDAAFHAGIAAAGRQFIVQVRDGLGCFHYAAVCGTRGTSADEVEIDLANDTGGVGRAVLVANAQAGMPEFDQVVNPAPPGVGNGTSMSTCGSSPGGRVRVAPLTRARWSIKASHASREQPLAVDRTYEGQKLDLVREILDLNGDVAWTETVLEYAIDLKFAIAAEPTLVGGGPLVVYDFDDAANISAYAGPTQGQTAGERGPEHIRSIRYRVSARTSTPDRKNSGIAPYPIRYCTNPPACTNFARIRTLVSEVALLNQPRMFY